MSSPIDIGIDVNVKYSATGHILSVSFKKNDLDDDLAHAGVKGMRWGVRKDRSENGTPRLSRKDAAKAKKEEVKGLSDDELRRRINRIQMEKQYSQLTTPQTSKGKQIAQEIILNTGKQLASEYLKNSVKTAISGARR
jgi:hypothetical protein